MIPLLSEDLLVRSDQRSTADHEADLLPDPTVPFVAALHGKCDHEVMSETELRLTALAQLKVEDEAKAWTMNIDGKNNAFVADAPIQEAATAPLPNA